MTQKARIESIIREVWQAHATNPADLPDEDAIKQMVARLVPEVDESIVDLQSRLLALLDLKGFTNIYLTFNEDSSGNYTTFAKMQEDYNGPEYRNLSIIKDSDFWVFGQEDYLKALDTNSHWVLQWYPHTQVGFKRIDASSLERIYAFLVSYQDGDDAKD